MTPKIDPGSLAVAIVTAAAAAALIVGAVIVAVHFLRKHW